MKIRFTTSGKYRNDDVVLDIKNDAVEDKAVFEVCENNAKSFIRAGKAELAEDLDPEDKEPDSGAFKPDLDKMKVPELKEFAADKEIDLGDATKKPEILEIIKASLEADSTAE